MTASASDFCQRLEPVGRVLELEGWHVWCTSAIDGPDGKVHLFCSRWPAEQRMAGWLTHSEIFHAVGDRAEGPFEVADVCLRGRGGDHWDSHAPHNPTIHCVDDRYYLFYIGNSDGTPDTQRTGLAVADSLDGPWIRIGDEAPILDVTPDPRAWDSYIAVNPAYLRHPDGEHWLYYKCWDRHHDGFRKMGLAVAERVEGPYRKRPENPLVSYADQRKHVEDAYVFLEDGRFTMVMADDGGGVVKNHGGVLVHSDDGIHWGDPELAYETSDVYFGGEVQRFERPQVLMRDGHPAYLYLALMGGRYGTSSGAVLRVRR